MTKYKTRRDSSNSKIIYQRKFQTLQSSMLYFWGRFVEKMVFNVFIGKDAVVVTLLRDNISEEVPISTK